MTLEGHGRGKDDFRIQTTRAHEGPLMDEKSRVTVGIGWRREDDVFVAFDAWAKRYTGSSSSVHTKRALIDTVNNQGSGKDGPRHDPRFGFDAAHVVGFVQWAHGLRDPKVAVLAPHDWSRLDDNNALIVGKVHSSLPTSWVREKDRLMIINTSRRIADRPLRAPAPDLVPASAAPARSPSRESHGCRQRPGSADMSDYTVVRADDVDDAYAGTSVPGEFRSLTDALGSEQLAITLIRVPPHSDFEQGTGHYHEEREELYMVTRGTLTMRFGDDIRRVGAGTVVRVAPRTRRSHRNEGEEPVEVWAVSRRLDREDAVKIDDFWEASPDAAQER